MPSSNFRYEPSPEFQSSVIREDGIESRFIDTLQGLKYDYRPDITNRATLQKNFREKFEALNRVRLTDAEFARLLDEIVVADVFTASKTLRSINSFTRDDGTPLYYTLVNIKDWCKNTFEVINQLRINTDNSHHRYDVILLINGVPCMQIFIVSNRDRTYYFANNNARHFTFNADTAMRGSAIQPCGATPRSLSAAKDNRFLPIYEFADEDNTKITHLDPFAERFLKKCDLGRTISRYMVLLAGEQKLMIMRPYQVYAVQRMVKCIDDDDGNGFVWHTTGSGKTLTSFKASPCSRKTTTSTNASSSWTAKTSTARRGKSSTAFRKAASRKTPTPPPSSAACCPRTTRTK